MVLPDPIPVSAPGVLPLCCPECGLELTAAVRGATTCPSCQTRYTTVVFSPPQEQGPVVQPSTSGAPCAQHARNLAVGSCTRCGSFMCELCRIDLDGKQVCPKCFNRAQAAAVTASSRFNYNSVGFLISLIGVPLVILGMFIGPIAIYFCIRGAIRNSRRNEDVARVPGILGIILGLLETLVGTLLFVGMLAAWHVLLTRVRH